jgi:HEAT repeat protein
MKDLKARTIIDLLEAPADDRRPTMQMIIQKAHIQEILLALESKPPNKLTRVLLCDILGYRHAKKAVPILLQSLTDESEKVRYSAADSLGKIKDQNSGQSLLQHYQQESDDGVRAMLSAALGAVQYKPAIPILVQALREDDRSLRGCAAWSLGELGAKDSLPALQDALTTETDSYARTRMEEAIKILTS